MPTFGQRGANAATPIRARPPRGNSAISLCLHPKVGRAGLFRRVLVTPMRSPQQKRTSAPHSMSAILSLSPSGVLKSQPVWAYQFGGMMSRHLTAIRTRILAGSNPKNLGFLLACGRCFEIFRNQDHAHHPLLVTDLCDTDPMAWRPNLTELSLGPVIPPHSAKTRQRDHGMYRFNTQKGLSEIGLTSLSTGS